jgi:hypothetical protein
MRAAGTPPPPGHNGSVAALATALRDARSKARQPSYRQMQQSPKYAASLMPPTTYGEVPPTRDRARITVPAYSPICSRPRITAGARKRSRGP